MLYLVSLINKQTEIWFYTQLYFQMVGPGLPMWYILFSTTAKTQSLLYILSTPNLSNMSQLSHSQVINLHCSTEAPFVSVVWFAWTGCLTSMPSQDTTNENGAAPKRQHQISVSPPDSQLFMQSSSWNQTQPFPTALTSSSEHPQA